MNTLKQIAFTTSPRKAKSEWGESLSSLLTRCRHPVQVPRCSSTFPPRIKTKFKDFTGEI